MNLFYYSLAAAILSAIILLFLFKRKYDLLFLSGIVLIVSSLLLMGIGKLISMFSNQIISGIALIFFSQTNFVFIRMLIAGIALIVAGLIVELFRAGFKIYDMFSRFENRAEENKAKTQKSKKK
jgi:membrane-bound ClpP family serine protease